MNNLLAVKEKLQTTLDKIQSNGDGSPVTNLKLDKTLVAEIEQITEELEGLNPNLYPLVHAPTLLQGTWRLIYSTAREIRSLDSLPLGLKVGKVYQAIDVANKSFFNLAFVKHPLGLVSGYVKITATFEPAKADGSPLPDKRINVYFDKRYLSIAKIVGIQTPQLNPFKVVQARSPQGRIPSLDITYLDETFRIGRGGDGSLFVLVKANDISEFHC
ncbi:MAG: PAP/fibrillin family protein [Calothrix sp. MO_167.B12]|nr:PAP/fibrillin family protein [Calothrix sp. MO_167.B12]